jgi:hypothetical protein
VDETPGSICHVAFSMDRLHILGFSVVQMKSGDWEMGNGKSV